MPNDCICEWPDGCDGNGVCYCLRGNGCACGCGCESDCLGCIDCEWDGDDDHEYDYEDDYYDDED